MVNCNSLKHTAREYRELICDLLYNIVLRTVERVSLDVVFVVTKRRKEFLSHYGRRVVPVIRVEVPFRIRLPRCDTGSVRPSAVVIGVVAVGLENRAFFCFYT